MSNAKLDNKFVSSQNVQYVVVDQRKYPRYALWMHTYAPTDDCHHRNSDTKVDSCVFYENAPIQNKNRKVHCCFVYSFTLLLL